MLDFHSSVQPQRVSFSFEDNGRFHDDLVLRLGDQVWRCDSYYLLLDPDLHADREDPEKVRSVLRCLLAQWHEAVAALREGESCYLPYDFSDEGTGWLRCEAVGPQLRIQQGWADVEGWSFAPSKVGALLRSLEGFRPDGSELTMTREEFLIAIGL